MSYREIQESIKIQADAVNRMQPIMQHFVWFQFAQMLFEGKQDDQTSRFFHAIPQVIRETFFLSPKPIIQFGSSCGKFLSASKLPQIRRCIGYDYSKFALELAEFNKLETRHIDLNVYDDSLAAETVINNDLQHPCDILAIRILEYLHPDAATLLVFALIRSAKPGTTFYIETFRNAPGDERSGKFTIEYPDNHFASFFGPRVDMQFIHHTSTPENQDEPAIDEGTCERLIVSKIG